MKKKHTLDITHIFLKNCIWNLPMNKLHKKSKIVSSLVLLPIFILIAVIFAGKHSLAAKLGDGTWTQSGSPGDTVIVFTNTGALAVGDDIVFSFPSTADVDAAGTDVDCTGQTTPTRTNNNTDNSIRIT